MTLPPGPYACLLSDPPWSFKTFSAKGHAKSAHAQYGCMSRADLNALPVQEIAAKDSVMFMWATFPMLPDAVALMAAWGFTYKTGGAWAKQSKTGAKWAFGTGYIFRSAAELLLVGTRGKPEWTSRSERNLWAAPVREHSRKPDCVHETIERLTVGPRLELFAREARPGWDVWGNQTDKFSEAA